MDLDAEKSAEIQETFNVYKPWTFGSRLTNVKITKEDHLEFNSNSGFWTKSSSRQQPYCIPKEFLLSVDVIKHEDNAFRKSFRILNQKSKVFDKVLELPAPAATPSSGTAATKNAAAKAELAAAADQLIVTYIHSNQCIWSIQRLKLAHQSLEVIAKWKSKLKAIIDKVRNQNWPRKLLIFINPFGGKGEALTLWNSTVRPLFQNFNIESSIIITERANHARDYLQDSSNDLDVYDGVICIGGDGMFAEVFNGILMRSGLAIEESGTAGIRPRLKVGIIPGGSTDAVATSLHGTNDVMTATLHIIIGDHRNVDVSSICDENGSLLRYASMISYGYFGDLMTRSEQYRWLGPRRYDFSGIRTFLGNAGYAGHISYVEAVRQSASTSIHDQCKSDCHTCQIASFDAVDIQGYLLAKVKEGKFSAITAACSKCASRFTPKGLSPGAHLGDGLLDLIFVSKTSRLNYFRYLFRSAYLRADPFDLPFVERIKVREFTYKVGDDGGCNDQCGKTSVWNCDGEILQCPQIHVKVHCQLLPVFARGPTN